MLRIPFLTGLLVATLPAQEPIPAEAFLPPDYRTLYLIDLAAMRERGIWDELDSSILSAALKGLEREAGFPLDHLDRLRASLVVPEDWDKRSPPPHVLVLEGHEQLDLPESVRNNERWQQETIAGFAVRIRMSGDREEVIVQPRSGLRIEGARSLVEPVLMGRRTKSQPAADVLSLLSGRGDNLACLVFDTSAAAARDTILGRLFPDTEWPEGDGPTFLMLRLRALGEADDPRLELEGVLRHAKGDAGLGVSEAAAKRWLEGLAGHPQYGAVKQVWRRIQLQAKGSDLVAKLDLGRARDGLGTLATLLAPLFPAPRAEVPVGEAKPVVPVAPPKDPGKQPR